MVHTTATPGMRVFEVHGGRGPALRRRDVPRPGPGEVQVRVEASSINARDLMTVSGHYSRPVPDGRIPLSDGAGVVTEVGAGVTRVAPGDRVMSLFHPTWLYGPLPGFDGLYGAQRDGWLTEYVVLGEQGLVGVPEHLSPAEAATLPCAALTAFSALRGIGAGDTVLVQGTGGVSVFALQFAVLAGARVLAATSSAEKAGRLRELGADDVVDRTATPEWGARVRELTGGHGVDLVVEIGGGGDSIDQSLEALTLGGSISLVGSLGNGRGLDPARFLGRAATMRTIIVGSRHDAERMNRVVTEHRLRPIIDRAFSFDEALDAFAHAATASHVGKIVIIHGTGGWDR